LVIGIDKYTAPGFDLLNNAVSDARALIDVLVTRYSFEIFRAPIFDDEATKENIYQIFNDVIASLNEDDNLLIYYAGHGWQHPLTKKGYWVPCNAPQSISEYIPNSEIKDFIESIKAKHIFLIADACFSGTFLTKTRGLPFERPYNSLSDSASRWMLASGGEESVSDGGQGQNSPFARYLLRFLTTNDNQYVSVQEIIRYVTVLTAQNSWQKPVGAQIENVGHENGEMIFILNDPWIITRYIKTKGEPQNISLLRELRSVYARRNEWPAGKEVVLVDSFINPGELLLIEFFRFDDQGNKKLLFQDDRLKMKAKDGENIEWTVLQRFATWQGFVNFWDSKQGQFKDRKVIAIPAVEEIDKVEETESAIWQQYVLQDLYDANQDPMRCLHCGQMISTNHSYLIEIDEIGLHRNVGNVHAQCSRIADRIMGKMQYVDLKENTILVNFDYKKWAELAETGQGIIWQTKSKTMQYKTVVLHWNREHSFNTGEYAMRLLLSDSSYEYMTIGRKVHRFTAAKVDKDLAFIRDQIQASVEEGRSFGCTSEQRQFGIKQQLEKSKLPTEKILGIVGVEKVKYSQQMETHQGTNNEYAPLGLLMDVDTGETINLGPYIPLIADPNQFETLHASWNKAGYEIGQCSLQILETDEKVDLYLSSFFEDGMQPIIDPEFDENKDLITGIYISDIKQSTERDNEHTYTGSDHPNWKAGDRVKIVFPEVQTDNPPIGILVMDEFIDEEGEPCVIFSAIEDGILRNDLTLKVPPKLLERI
jgi:hypothetical protein